MIDYDDSSGEPSRLSGKLRRAFKQRRSPQLRAFLQRRAGKLAGAPKPEVELPPGTDVQNAGGSCYVRQLRYPWSHPHGDHELGVVQRVDWSRVAELGKDEGFERAGLGRCLFLDTETTGLMGGAGTTVFLTGIGWFESSGFVLEQVFLRSFEDDAAAMLHVAERLRQRPMLVSFVGKSFDRHRIAARMAVHHIDAPILDPLHLDLYYLARRRWKDELPDTKLRTVEELRLGVFRDDDLPGSEAPYAFLSWIRDRTGAVDRVLEHNRLDVLSLVTLLGVLGRC